MHVRMLNRRAMIAGTAAGAISAPAIAVGADPDAELIQLAKDMDRLLADLDLKNDEAEKRSIAWLNEVKHRGLSIDAEDRAAIRLSDEMGATAACAACGAICDELNEILQKIRDIRPQTVQGLAIWARALRVDLPEEFSRELSDTDLCNMDFEQAQLYRFLVEVDRMAGYALTA